MTTKQQRLKEVYEHLRAHYGIHTQIDLAEAIHITRPALSSAMNGNDRYLTKNLFQKICASFPGVFNLDYLLTGEGSLLANGDESNDAHMVKEDAPPTDEVSSNILELYARMIRGVDDLRIQLKEQLSEVQTVKSELQQVRDDLRTTTQRLSRALEQLNKNGNSHHIGIAADDGDN
jgi:transcriptional regulator with XRE-family HTH domain